MGYVINKSNSQVGKGVKITNKELVIPLLVLLAILSILRSGLKVTTSTKTTPL